MVLTGKSRDLCLIVSNEPAELCPHLEHISMVEVFQFLLTVTGFTVRESQASLQTHLMGMVETQGVL